MGRSSQMSCTCTTTLSNSATPGHPYHHPSSTAPSHLIHAQATTHPSIHLYISSQNPLSPSHPIRIPKPTPTHSRRHHPLMLTPPTHPSIPPSHAPPPPTTASNSPIRQPFQPHRSQHGYLYPDPRRVPTLREERGPRLRRARSRACMYPGHCRNGSVPTHRAGL